MALKDFLFTSESVSEGHPDKVCDQISDAILDAFIANDVKLGIADESHINTRLGCEDYFADNKFCFLGIFFEEVQQHFTHCGVYRAHSLGITKFRFGLAFKLRFGNFYRNDCSQSFSEIITTDINLCFFQQA